MELIHDRSLATGLWFAAVLLVSVAGTSATAQERETSGLEAVFSPGRILQDRNGDEVIDFVNAAIVVGESPTVSDIAAAADIAARLGYETMAMDIPLASMEESSGPAILVGSAALTRAGVAATEVGLAGLKSGEGIITLLTANGREWLVIAGADEAGTRAAAEVLAGRLPYVWDPEGATLEKVVEELRAFLTAQEISVSAVQVPAVHVKAGEETLKKLVVMAKLGSATDVGKAESELRALARRRADERAPLSYAGARVLRVVLSAPGTQTVEVEVPRGEMVPTRGPTPPRPGSEAKIDLDLSNFYTLDGFLGDSNEDLIADRVDVLLSPSGEGTEGTVDLAARIGLESAGISIPIARDSEAIEKPEEQPTLVLIGTDHPLVQQLVQEGKLQLPPLEVGQGLIQVVPKAFGDKSAVVITGGDGAGVTRALQQVAERFPNVWERGKDRTTIDGVEEDARRFLSGRSPAGQAATALYKLDRLVRELSGKDLESAHVVVSVEKPADGFEQVVRERAEALRADSLEVTIDNRDVEKAAIIFEEEFEVASEVTEFWGILRSEVLPGVKKGQPVVVEVRLSEPPEIRAKIEGQARAELIVAGAAEVGTEVTVLSAYKQGYSWLYDVVRPALEGQTIDHLTIRFAESGPPPEWKQQAMYTPSRWLLELFPIDETLARELNLDVNQIGFEMMPIGAPTYEAVATAPDGTEILRSTFEPKYVVRPFFDRFPDYEKVRVTTGWITARVGSETIVDRRIVTDVERFWDHYQEKTLPSVYEYVMDITGGKPRAADAPHFGKLVVDLTLSEPNYLLDVDREIIASMEAMHEEIYFHTLHFFDVLGRFTRGEALNYIGRVIPIMRPKGDGKPGQAKISFSGFRTNRPAVVVEYTERGGRRGEARLDVSKIKIKKPRALAALVRAGQPGLERLDLRVKVDTETDERDELVKRERAEQVDEQILSAEQVGAILANLERLRGAGLYREALAYHDVGVLTIAAGWEHKVDPANEALISLDRSGTPEPFPEISSVLPSGYRYEGGPIVQWDTPIPPGEAAELLAKLSTFDEANVYKLGESYLGTDIWAMDLMPPIEASHWSHAKATTLKPTIVYSGRQDANEVSSTSHLLKLSEMLLTEPEFRKKLDRVNVVVHPITNPGGAQLAYDLYKITPDYMLHAGYLGPLGVSLVTRWDSDPIYPESKHRVQLWRTWLPDIFLNPHGYPSHEWVQLFSEYAAWVRNRATESRDWWGTRGWFVPSFNYLDDPKYPRHKEAAFQIRERITEYINAAPDVRALNQRNYDRYRRYGFAHDQENFKLDFTNDVLIYSAIKGWEADPGTRDTVGDNFMVRNPKVTIFYGATEAPDETAYGDWMTLVATAGLQWDKANLDHLVEGDHAVERSAKTFFGGVSLSMLRPRPPKPKEEGIQ